MKRLQKIMSLTLALLMVLSSLPIWAEGEPIVIVESTETPAPQAEKTPEATAKTTSAPTTSAPKPKEAPPSEEPPVEEPAADSVSTPATQNLTQAPSAPASSAPAKLFRNFPARN